MVTNEKTREHSIKNEASQKHRQKKKKGGGDLQECLNHC